MEGTVIITGANGSLAIPAVAHLRRRFPKLRTILTVRNAAESDVNTARLRNVIAEVPGAEASIYELDLASLADVHKFADHVIAGIADGTYPALRSIICNAFYWNLATAGGLTEDGYEKTFQINHIANVALVMRLIGSFQPTGGRITFLTAKAHWPGKNPLQTYPPAIPDDLDLLVQVSPGSDHTGLGFQRYANSKLASLAHMYALNRRLEKDPTLSHITIVATEPGDLGDSRALRTNTPGTLVNLQRFVLRPLGPVLRFLNPAMRTSAEAAEGVIELGVGEAHPGERGYFNLLEKGESSPDSLDKNIQERIWSKSAEWARITKDNTALRDI